MPVESCTEYDDHTFSFSVSLILARAQDLKSENILVEPTGVCKISDFGISKRLSPNMADEKAFTELRGTLFWMAPEVHNILNDIHCRC